MLVEPLDATLGAVVRDMRLAELDEATWLDVEAAFHEHAVLVFPDQHLTAAQQVAFGQRFGPIEELVPSYQAIPLSNVDLDGRVRDPDDSVMQIQRGNEGWHTDSSYMELAAKASVLAAVEVPTDGGETEWADMRAAYEALDPATQELLAGLSAHHSIVWSQQRAGFTDTSFSYGNNAGPAPVRSLVKMHPATGRPALFIGRHAHAIEGMDLDESQALLDGLLDDACQPPRTYRHTWTPGEVAVWDNRCVLHRARPWDYREHRVMRHVRIKGDPATETALAR